MNNLYTTIFGQYADLLAKKHHIYSAHHFEAIMSALSTDKVNALLKKLTGRNFKLVDDRALLKFRNVQPFPGAGCLLQKTPIKTQANIIITSESLDSFKKQFLQKHLREIDPFSLRISDQGTSGTCVAHGCRNSLTALALMNGFSVNESSANHGYYLAKLADGSLPIDWNAGLPCDAVFRTLAGDNKVLLKLVDWPDDNFDIPEEDVLNRVNTFKLQNYASMNFHEDPDFAENFIRERSCYMGASVPFPIAITLFEETLNAAFFKTGLLHIPFYPENVVGGHMVMGIGIDKFQDETVIIALNSWGNGFASDGPFGNGIITIPLDYFKSYGSSQILFPLIIDEVSSLSRNIFYIHKKADHVVTERQLSVQSSHKMNWHIVILGTTGGGKSSFVKSLIYENTDCSDFFVPEYHHDFSNDSDFLDATGAVSYKVAEDGLPFSILENDDLYSVLEVLECFKKILPTLGPKQLSLLFNALKDLGDTRDFGKALEKKLQALSANKTYKSVVDNLILQLSPVLQVDILRTGDYTLQKLFKDSPLVILDLTGSCELLKKLVTYFSVKRLLEYKKKVPGRPLTLVQDEFHLCREFTETYQNIQREGRKYGLNNWIISQQYSEVKPFITNAGTIIVFNIKGQDASALGRSISGSTEESQAISRELTALEKFEVVIKEDGKPYRKEFIVPFFKKYKKTGAI